MDITHALPGNRELGQKHVPEESQKAMQITAVWMDLLCASNIESEHLDRLHHATMHIVLYIWHAEEQKRKKLFFFPPTLRFELYSKGVQENFKEMQVDYIYLHTMFDIHQGNVLLTITFFLLFTVSNEC